MADKRIKCLVEECAYYSNDLCEAPSIEVISCGDKVVKSTDGTACKTFRSK